MINNQKQINKVSVTNLIFVLFTFIIYSCKIASSDKDTCLDNFEQILYKKIDFHKIDIDTSNYVDNYYYEDSNRLTFGYRIWTLDKAIRLKHYSSNRSIPSYIAKYENDSISVYYAKYSINDLYTKAITNNSLRANPIDIIKSYIWEVYSFNFKENKYIIVHIADRQVNGFYPYYFSILFDITDINEIKAIPIGEIIAINNPDYISISQDSLLTLHTWNLSDTLHSYFIDKKGKCIKNNNFLSIYIDSYYEDTSIPKIYKIDINNSKWSNTIKNNNNDCEWNYLYPDRDNMYTNYPSIEK